jgi:hypothetical protein
MVRWEDHIIKYLGGILNYTKFKDVQKTDLDYKHCTDYLIKDEFEIKHIALRVRECAPYNDITIRAKRKNGNETELDKIINNQSKTDYIFYAKFKWNDTILNDTNNFDPEDWFLVIADTKNLKELVIKYNEEANLRWNIDKKTALIGIPLEELNIIYKNY